MGWFLLVVGQVAPAALLGPVRAARDTAEARGSFVDTGLAGLGLEDIAPAGTGLAGTDPVGLGLEDIAPAGTGLVGTGLVGTGLVGTGLVGTGLEEPAPAARDPREEDRIFRTRCSPMPLQETPSQQPEVLSFSFVGTLESKRSCR